MNGSLSGLTDTELAARAREGNGSAFEIIYDRHADGIARTLAAFAGPGYVELSDLVQEVFVRVIDNLNSYRPTAPFKSWLYTIALNVGRNHVRSRPRYNSVDPARLAEDQGDINPGVDSCERRTAERALKIVAGLSDGTREVVALRIGSGLPYGEIAEILGIPEGTARRRIHDAVRTIRARIGLTLTK